MTRDVQRLERETSLAKPGICSLQGRATKEGLRLRASSTHGITDIPSSSNAEVGARGLTVLGLDPGLRRTGYAVASIDGASGHISNVLAIGVLRTERSQQRLARKTSDDLARARMHTMSLKRLLADHEIDLIASEISTTTPYTYPTFSFGVMIGVLASLDRPIIEVLPYEAKLAATGNPRASKCDIIAWAIELPASRRLEWPTSGKRNSLGLCYEGKNITKDAEHMADALAVVSATSQTEQYRLAHSLGLPAAR